MAFPTKHAAAAPTCDAKHPAFIMVSEGMSGYFATLVWWNPEHGGFYEPYNTGAGRYATSKEAEADAKAWAAEEGLEFRP